jgi:hypothetical protein
MRNGSTHFFVNKAASLYPCSGLRTRLFLPAQLRCHASTVDIPTAERKVVIESVPSLGEIRGKYQTHKLGTRLEVETGQSGYKFLSRANINSFAVDGTNNEVKTPRISDYMHLSAPELRSMREIGLGLRKAVEYDQTFGC